jgi:hypothetical protein
VQGEERGGAGRNADIPQLVEEIDEQGSLRSPA